jgi:hypothetical protein
MIDIFVSRSSVIDTKYVKSYMDFEKFLQSKKTKALQTL